MGTCASRTTGANSACSKSARWPPAFIIVALTLVLIGRLVVLQISRYDYYAELSRVTACASSHCPRNAV